VDRDRDAAMAALAAAGIDSGVYYPLPIHHQPLYHQLGYDVYLPHTDTAAGTVLSLPVHPGLSAADLDRICTVVQAL
jgi:perosamine synthetase